MDERRGKNDDELRRHWVEKKETNKMKSKEHES